MAKICPSCGTQNEDTAIFCDNCGSSFAAAAPAPAPLPFPPPAAPPPAAGGSLVCPTCGHPAMVGEMFCDNCGASLAGAVPGAGAVAPAAPPYQPPSFQPPPYQPPPLQQPPPYQPPPFPQPSYQPPSVGGAPTGGRLMIGGAQIPLPPKPEVTIGRPDQYAQPPWQPDIDLTPYGGGELTSGISRRHAKLTWQGAWYVEDMNSVNGVFVRGQKIFQPTPLNNGDQIGLGRLIITFYA